MQNGIAQIVEKHPLIPVVTINQIDDVDSIAKKLIAKSIGCVEVTLRTNVSWEAIALFKQKYGDRLSIGVGTVTTSHDVDLCVKSQVDFIVSPGTSQELNEAMLNSGIPFLPGVSTPSEIITGIGYGWGFMKFFPAHLFGGLKALKVYHSLFKEIKFCPTGGINANNYQDYLELKNVIAVGGSWLTA